MGWTFGSVYWACVGRTSDWEGKYGHMGFEGHPFVVRANNLGFSVLAFSACCIVGLSLLVVRRKFLGCELGGPMVSKVVTCCAFVSLWFGSVGVVIWRVLRWEVASTMETLLVLAVALSLLVLLFIGTVVIVAWDAKRMPPQQPEEKLVRTASMDGDDDIAHAGSLKGCRFAEGTGSDDLKGCRFAEG